MSIFRFIYTYEIWQKAKRGGRRSHSLGDFFAAQKAFVCFKKAPKQTLCSLPTSDMLDIAINSMFKTSSTIYGTSVADKIK